MIQTYTWRVDLPLGQPIMRAADKFILVANGISAYTSFLLGGSYEVQDGKLLVSLRVSGKDRWAAQAHGRQVGEAVFKAAGFWGLNAELVEVVTEPNRRGLKDGEGRTPRPRPPRASATVPNP